MNRMLSVVIPFYCTPENLFRHCMGSLLDNELANIEVIVVDDGSPAEKRGCLEDYVQDDRVRIIYADHKGVSAARNRGINEARGSYIMFVDSDDYVDKDTLCRIVDGLDDFSGEMELFGGGSDSAGKIVKNTSFLSEDHDYGKDLKQKIKIMESALSAGMLPKGYTQRFTYGSPCCKLFDREFLNKNGMRFDEGVKFAEDVLFLLHVYQAAQSIFYHDWFLYYYVHNSQSVTRKFRPGLSADMAVFFEKLKQFIEENALNRDLERAYYLRAEMEAGRCFTREFFNLSNTDKKAKKQYKAFIGKEPFKTGLKKGYIPKDSLRHKVYRFLVRHGYGGIFRLLQKLRT